MAKVAVVTAAFALVHSALASRAAKETSADKLGRRNRNGLYRVFFLVQSVLTLGAIMLYLRRLPDEVLYRVQGLPARLMNLGQAAGLVYATYTAYEVGLGGILGLTSLLAWLRGEEQVPPEPDAQGPRLDADGEMHAAGPFTRSRHPLNLSPLPVFWLAPVMTAKLLAFNLVATLYLVLGSIHEERRLRAAYGPAYGRYQRSGVNFFVPGAVNG